MGIVVSGTDERLERLTDMLKETGAEVCRAQSPKDFEGREIFIGKYPFDALAAGGIARMKKGAKLIVLNAAPVEKEICEAYRVYPLSEESVFVNENAVYTAEGAVARAMQLSEFALFGEKVAVIGYGRIGRALTEILVGLKTQLTVFSRRESGRLQAMARGAKGADIKNLCELLPDFRVIFVTSPDRMLSQKELSYISPNALIFDVSSAPYGVDAEAAAAMGLKVHVEGALPGRYCPESAARAMYRAVKRITGGVGL